MSRKLSFVEQEKESMRKQSTLPLQTPEAIASSVTDAKDDVIPAGFILSNGMVSTGKVRRRESGAVIKTIKVTSPMTAVRAKCLDCSGGSSNEVALCTSTGCPLFVYRSGHRPKTGEAKPRSAAQIAAQAANAERLRNRGAK
jgi:hypothetical protein